MYEAYNVDVLCFFYVRQYLSDSLVIAEKTYQGTVLHKQGCFIIKCNVNIYNNNIIKLLVAKQQDYIKQERINLSHLVMNYTCTQCGKTFTNEFTRRRYMKLHVDNVALEYNFCGK